MAKNSASAQKRYSAKKKDVLAKKAIAGSASKNKEHPASIDYRLRAKSVINSVRQGRTFKTEVCDAHPELLRVAKGVGESCNVPCPICDEENTLVTVSYMFGARFGPGGRCMADLNELQHIARTKAGIFTCYIVEVCISCSWNYLIQSFPVQGEGEKLNKK